MKVTIKDSRSLTSGQTHVVEVGRSDTTLSLKEKIQFQGGPDVAAQRILFAGRALEDNIKLTDAGVADGATLYIIVRQVPEHPTQETPQTPERLQALLDCYEITIAQAADLEVLKNYDVVFILDDSGSMSIRDRVGGPTRWDELKETVQTMIEFAAYFSSYGTDLHFLNRPSVTLVRDAEDPRVLDCFRHPPRGLTPLTEKVRQVVASRSVEDPPLLLVIATDGEPNGGSELFKQALDDIIKDPSREVRFQIMACTDDDSSIAWLNKFDDKFTEVDVCDDFHSERKEVLKAGRVANFTRADWIVKAVLGPISQKFDDWDNSQKLDDRDKAHNSNTPGKLWQALVCLVKQILFMALMFVGIPSMWSYSVTAFPNDKMICTGVSLVVGGVAYVNLPVDLIPDCIPLIGKWDDTAAYWVVALGFAMAGYGCWLHNYCPVETAGLERVCA